MNAEELIGQSLDEIYQTRFGKGYNVVQGLGKSYYFSVIISTSHSGLLELTHDSVVEWNRKEKIFPIKPTEHGIDAKLQYRKKRIVSVTHDENGILEIGLENGLVISATVDLGTSIHIFCP